MGEQDTIDELLSAWDRGEWICTIEMSGLGPSHEQAVQIAAVEYARAGRSMERTEDEEFDKVAFGHRCDAWGNKLSKQIGGGMTGAMHCAAKWLAWQWCFGPGGPAGLRQRTKEQGQEGRLIMCSKAWPGRASAGSGGRLLLSREMTVFVTSSGELENAPYGYLVVRLAFGAEAFLEAEANPFTGHRFEHVELRQGDARLPCARSVHITSWKLSRTDFTDAVFTTLYAIEQWYGLRA